MKNSYSGRLIALSAIVLMAMAALPATVAGADDLPGVQTVVDKYLDALGGRAAIEGITSRSMKGTFSLIDMGIMAAMEVHVQGDESVTRVSLEGMGEVVSGITGGIGWESHFMNGDSILDDKRKAAAIKQAGINEYLDWEKWYTGAEVTGEADVDGEATYTVVFTPEEGLPSTVYFAKDSGLIIQSEGTGPDGMPTTSRISDYQESGGVLFPHEIESSGMMTIQISFDTVEVNVDIPAETFAYPASIAALLNPPKTDAEDEEGSDHK